MAAPPDGILAPTALFSMGPGSNSNAPYQPMGVGQAMTGDSTPPPPPPSEGAPGSGGFPAPPPPPSAATQSPGVYGYFPGSGNQPPISPPPSLRNSNVRPPFMPGQQGSFQGLPATMASYTPGQQQQQMQQIMSPISPQQSYQQPFQQQLQQPGAGYGNQGPYQQQQQPPFSAPGAAPDGGAAAGKPSKKFFGKRQ